ncbi:MAG: alkaline phosphatase family protein [Acidobacteriota bacterium]
MRNIKRVFINSIFCSILFCLLILSLLKSLNYWISIPEKETLAYFLWIFIFYGFFLIAFSFILYFFYKFFSTKEREIKTFDIYFLTGEFSLIFILLGIIFFSNVKYYRIYFPDYIYLRIIFYSFFLIAYGILGFATKFLRKYKRELSFFFVFLSFLIPIFIYSDSSKMFKKQDVQEKIEYFQWRGVPRKVVILSMEGLTLDFIIPLISEGNLPNFSYLMENGSWKLLKNFSPNEYFSLYTSFENGKYPSKNRAFSKYFQFKFCKSSLLILPRYLLIAQGEKVGIFKSIKINYPGDTKGIFKILSEAKSNYWDSREVKNRENIMASSSVGEKAFAEIFQDLLKEKGWKGELLKKSFITDVEESDSALKEKEKKSPILFFLHLQGLDLVEHYFYKYSKPELFLEQSEEEREKFSDVIYKYYKFYDSIIGKFLFSLKENEIFIVFSPHGMDPYPLWKRVLGWFLGKKEISSYHDEAPEGIVFFYGNGISKGKSMDSVSLVDLAPTIFYMLGLPVANDMDGIVINSILEREFSSRNPMFYISSYDYIKIIKKF